MSRSRVFFFVLLSFIAGVFVRSFWNIELAHIYLALLILLIVFFVSLFAYRQEGASGFVALIAFLLIVFICGQWLTDGKIAKTNDLIHVGKTFQENAVVEKSTSSSFGQNIIAKLQNEKISILMQVPQYPKYNYGDKLEIVCDVKAIENKNADFDYRMFMAKDNVLYQCEKIKIKKVGENYGNEIYARIFILRKALEDKISKIISMPEAALANGLLFGGSGELSKEIQADFSKTGMTHIVAVSGYNVTIIAEYLILVGIFLGLWRKQAIWFAIIGIVLFVILTGLPASAVRAGVMSSVLLWAMKNGRLASAENAIIFAGAIMLTINPLLLRWDVGFQLSFLATLGIVLTSSFWEKSFLKNNKALGISEIIVLSLSAQIFVLPIIAYNFKTVSFISLLANVFILPIIPLSMLLVFLVTVAGFLFIPLAIILGWLAYVLLFYEITLIHVLAQFPWANIQMEKVSVWMVAIYYIILIGSVMVIKRFQANRVHDE